MKFKSVLLALVILCSCKSQYHFSKRKYLDGHYIGHHALPQQKLHTELKGGQEPQVFQGNKAEELSNNFIEASVDPNTYIDHSKNDTYKFEFADDLNKPALKADETIYIIGPNNSKFSNENPTPPDDDKIDITRNIKVLFFITAATLVTTGIGFILSVPLLIWGLKRRKLYKADPGKYKNGEDLKLYLVVASLGTFFLAVGLIFAIIFIFLIF
jgi:hypothetical protein